MGCYKGCPNIWLGLWPHFMLIMSFQENPIKIVSITRSAQFIVLPLLSISKLFEAPGSDEHAYYNKESLGFDKMIEIEFFFLPISFRGILPIG